MIRSEKDYSKIIVWIAGVRFFSTRFMLKPNKFARMISQGIGAIDMRSIVFGFVLIFSSTVLAQQSDMQNRMNQEKPVALMSGLGTWHHGTSTKNPEAQRFFDQGLRMTYGFNHEEAVRSFKRAAELDPQMAMAWWGVAYALGPNINLDVDPDREKAAYEATQKALDLAKSAPANERDYIAALAKRYSNDPKADLKKLSADYSKAMNDLMKKYPDDLDAATLYAESMMDLHPWQLWSTDGEPAARRVCRS